MWAGPVNRSQSTKSRQPNPLIVVETPVRWRLGSVSSRSDLDCWGDRHEGIFFTRLKEGSFHPLQLTKEASLNRTLLADLPGADPNLVGKAAGTMLSLEALSRLTSAYGAHVARRQDVPWHLRAMLDSATASEADLGRKIVTQFGRRLGHLLATLRVGEEHASPWRTAYRRHWREVERIWIGGGTMAALGDDLLPVVRAEAQRLGADAATIELAPHADVLALIGAARIHREAPRRAMVFDFGYSSVKRGVANFERNALRSLHVLPSYSLPRPGLESDSTAERVADAMIGLIVATFRQIAHDDLDSVVVVSLATYLRHGRPWASAELYDQLSGIDLNALDATLTRVAGRPLHVSFVHDGTTAAAGLPTDGRDGVVVLGSSLGAGFTLPTQPRLPVAELGLDLRQSR